MTELEGILLVDKPSGITSHDVVDRVRRLTQMKRIGHAGTLDPMATGLMIVLVGKATKASQFLMSLAKEYTGTIRLGEETNTCDAEGQITTTRPVPPLTEEEVRASLNGFLGDQYQIPPMFSAIKIGGVPLYKLARQGEEIVREPRFIRISEFELKRWETPDLDFRLACSKGTYVRSVAKDLGDRLQCGAHLAALRRTKIDKLTIEQAVTLEQFGALSQAEKQARLISVSQAVPAGVVM